MQKAEFEAPTPGKVYEAPRIEMVLEAAEIEREMFYAGGITCPDCFPT
ncbi:MAG: hypothetical protein ACR2IE_00355 [Candidatus Sumerlaeaceae bacterium]